MRSSVRLLNFLAFAILPVSAANIVTDFPALATNPNGVWSYGYKSSPTGTLTLFGSVSFFDNSTGHGWNGGSDLSVYRPEADSLTGTVYLDDDFLNLHPSMGGLLPVVRWTAPTTATYDISFLFKMHDTTPSGVNLYVAINDAVEWSNSFASGAPNSLQTKGTSMTRTLNAGSTVDFQMDYAGYWAFDSTGLQGTIAAQSAVPEPSAIALVAGGLVALGVFRRRS